jgi:hypothetical protein
MEEVMTTGAAGSPGRTRHSLRVVLLVGHDRANSDRSAVVQHGIDNWRVEVCR